MKTAFSRYIKICPQTGKFRGFKYPAGFSKLLFPLIGLAAIIWILVRVIPKPSRAQYPCMKVAAPIASGFLVYVGSLAAAVFSFRKSHFHFSNSKTGHAILFAGAFVIIVLFSTLRSDSDYFAQSRALRDSVFVPTDSANSPIGTARGIFPGRVVWMHDPSVVTWDGKTGYWWNDSHTQQKIVDSMLSASLHSLSGKSTDTESWDAIFKYFNKLHGKGNTGYTAGEKIAIKINLNDCSGPGNPGNVSLATPQTILSLLRQLVNKAGVQDSNITVYDMIRYISDPIYNKCKPEFPRVHFMGWEQKNGREKYIRDTTRIYFSQKLDLEKDITVSAKGGNPAYLPTSVTQAAYLINLANLKGHHIAGLTSCAKNHFGSLSVDDDQGQPFVYAPHAAGVHPYAAVHDVVTQGSPEWSFKARPMASYNTLVDLMGQKDLGGKTLLFMVDAIYANPDESGTTLISNNTKWVSSPFNNNWTCSLFLSQDNVAIESVALDFIRTEQKINNNIIYVFGNVDNYLHEAALADNPPSGAFYAPNGDGVRLQSLGVHEHWNNAVDKQYSRNLGTGNGIELIKLTGNITSLQQNNKVPGGYVLNQNYPNPFNPSTIINYSIPKAGIVKIKIYDEIGKEVRTLVNEYKSAGSYMVHFSGNRLANGIYFYKMQSGNFSQTKKLVLIK